MLKTTIKNLETNIQKNCDILKKNDRILEVVIENTTIKLTLFKKNLSRRDPNPMFIFFHPNKSFV